MKSNILATGITSGIGFEFTKKNPVWPIYRNDNIQKRLDEMQALNCKVNGFVHFAGIAYTEPVNMFTREKFEEIMWSNVGLAMEIIKIISKKQYSENLSIVLISSVAAMKGASCISQYAASKAAIIGLTKSLAVELAPKGIRVNCISPGHVKNTRMSNQNEQKIGKDGFEKIEKQHLLGFGHAEDVCNMVEYLLSDRAKWITGQNFVIDGGYTA